MLSRQGRYVAGELDITPRHAPLITQLKAGPVRVLKEDDEKEFLFLAAALEKLRKKLKRSEAPPTLPLAFQ